MTQRKALIVGINSYRREHALTGCVNDAQAMSRVLSRNRDGSKNFDCSVMLDRADDGGPILRTTLRAALKKLFDGDSDVLFFFSGHGFLEKTGGMLCTSDATDHDWGVPMQEVADYAQCSRARQVLIMLDCCHSGDVTNLAASRSNVSNHPIALLRENMTIIAGCRWGETAVEGTACGMFTAALIDGLEGGAADHIGQVTAPALFSYVRRRFTAWDQSPMFKMNASDIFNLRECEPRLGRMDLQQLPLLFPRHDSEVQLDPEFEPEDELGRLTEPVNKEKVAMARLLKTYRDAGLVCSSDEGLQFYWVARFGKRVRLTAQGREYWWLVVNDRI